jgi:SAM-dependent methyltransferase
MNEPDVTQRFSNRVDDYVRYRPDYPPALIDWLRTTAGLTPTWHVADIGAGTGISSKLFLEAGHAVTAVEPNAPMRAAAQRWLNGYSLFQTVDGRAEATGLPAASVDLVSAAQAFHWFDTVAVRKEWKRILRPDGLVVIYWNSRRLVGSPFLEGYEKLLRTFGTDYASVAERYADDAVMKIWFGAGLLGSARFDHRQLLDFDGLRGRLLSSSYAPAAGHRNHEPMLAELRKLFDATAENGLVHFDYDTRAHLGRIL